MGVNLLPVELRTGRTARRSLAFPLIFLVLVSSLVGAYLRLDGVLAQQEERQAELQKSIAALAQVRVRRELLMSLEAELGAVRGEFARRTPWSQYTDELTARLPFGVVIKDLRSEGVRLTLSAQADSMSQVAQFVSNVTASPLFKEPMVSQLTMTPGARGGVSKVDFSAVVEIVPTKQGLQP